MGLANKWWAWSPALRAVRAARERVTLIKRMAVRRPGQRYGRALLIAVVDTIFKQTNAWRVWLGVFPENLRARRAYEAVGFQAEGAACGSAFFGGGHRDELVMAMLRPENWVLP